MDISKIERIKHLYDHYDSMKELDNYYSVFRSHKYLKKFFDTGARNRNLIFVKKDNRIHIFNVRNGFWLGFIYKRVYYPGTEYIFYPNKNYVLGQSELFILAYVVMLFYLRKMDYDKFEIFPRGFDLEEYEKRTGIKFIIPKFEEDDVIY